MKFKIKKLGLFKKTKRKQRARLRKREFLRYVRYSYFIPQKMKKVDGVSLFLGGLTFMITRSIVKWRYHANSLSFFVY